MIPGMLTWFSRRIPIQFAGTAIFDVSNLEWAGELLLDPRWPKKKGRAYNAAVMAILEGGAADVAAAEKAFEAAARDAGVLREITHG